MVTFGECSFDVEIEREHLLQLSHRLGEERGEGIVVLRRCGQTGDFSQTFQRHVSEERHVQEFVNQRRDQFRLEDVAQRHPAEEPEQRLQCCSH